MAVVTIRPAASAVSATPAAMAEKYGSLMSLNRSLSLATWLLAVTTSSLRLPGSGGCLVRVAVHPPRL